MNDQELKEILSELSRRMDDLHVEVGLLRPGAPRSSPTASTLGKLALANLNKYKNMGLLRNISADVFPASPEPFLGPAAIQELDGKIFANESELIQWFEPHFTELMESVSDELGYKIILLNSERHPWTKDPHGGADSKPDGVGLAIELVSFNKTNTDVTYSNDEDPKFGAPANWVLRDSLEFVAEWKVDGGSFNRALGEGIDYHRRIFAPFKSDRNVQDTIMTTDLLVATQQSFMLTRCMENNARFAYQGKWDSPGSKEALRRFALGTLWLEDPRLRPWKDAFQAVCQKLKVELVEPTADGKDCFLGFGASGRVFRVKRADGTQCALKLALGGGVARLLNEDFNNLRYKDELDRANATVRIVGSHDKPSAGYAAILSGPVGMPMRPTKRDVTAALISLKRLHEAGLAHGDSRWENAIIVEDESGVRKCLWLDLFTLERVSAVDEREAAFANDVRVFFDSFHCDEACSNLSELALAYLGDDEKLGSLLIGMAVIWQTR